MIDNAKVVLKALLLQSLTDIVKGVDEDEREALRDAVWGSQEAYEAWVDEVYKDVDSISIHVPVEDALTVIKEELSKLSTVVH